MVDSVHYLKTNLAAFEELAGEFGEKIPLRQARTKQLIDTFIECVTVRFPSARVLELGPGAGGAAKVMIESGLDVTCIEFSPKMALVASRTTPQARVIVDEFLAHDFGSQKFDAIVAIAFVHLFPPGEARGLIKKIYDLLDSNGLALISTTLHQSSREGYEIKKNFRGDVSRYRRRFTREEFEQLIVSGGFEIATRFDNSDLEEPGKFWMNYVVNK